MCRLGSGTQRLEANPTRLFSCRSTSTPRLVAEGETLAIINYNMEDKATWLFAGDSLRQRARVHAAAFSGVVRETKDRDRAYRAGQMCLWEEPFVKR